MGFDISVIVPVYNAEIYIEKCLDSIMSQTVNTLEIICVNDGSKDNSLSVLNRYKDKYKYDKNRSIVIIDKENGGPSSARNVGLRAASGEYIAFVDSDDYIEKEMYDNLIKISKKEDLDVVICNILNSYPDGRQISSPEKIPANSKLSKEDITRLIYPTLMKEDIFGGPCNRVYKRKFLIENKIFMPEYLGYGEDAVFQMKVFDCLKETWFDSGCYYHYEHREGSQSSAKPGRLKDTLEPLYVIRCEYGQKWGISLEEISDYFVYCTIMDLIETMRNKTYREKVSYIKYFIKCDNLKKALKSAKITPGMYTKKIYGIYIILKVIL